MATHSFGVTLWERNDLSQGSSWASESILNFKQREFNTEDWLHGDIKAEMLNKTMRQHRDQQ